MMFFGVGVWGGMENDVPMSNEEAADYWRGTAQLCLELMGRLPYAESPNIPAWHHPDEAWKNAPERRNYVEEAAPLSAEVIALLLAGKPIPRRAAKGVFLAAERLRHARRVLAILATTPQNPTGTGVPLPPSDSPIETIRWLALDTYDAGHLRGDRWELSG
jgi:hypothetical protein